MSKEQNLEADEFRCFYNELCKQFPLEYGLPKRLLNMFCNRKEKFTLAQLSQLAENWYPLNDRTGLSADSFQKLVIHAIVLLRGAAIYLRKIGKNPQSFIISRPDYNQTAMVVWHCEPNAMEEIILQV